MHRTLPHPGFGMSVVLCLVFIGTQMVFSTPLTMLDLLFENVLKQPPPQLGLSSGGMSMVNILAAAAAVGLGAYLNRIGWRALWPTPRITLLQVVAAIVSILGAVLLLSEVDNLLRHIMSPPRSIQAIFEQLFRNSTMVGQIWLLVIVAPVTEELLFRGIILRGLLSRYGPWLAVFLSSMLFGLIHINPWQIPHAFALGLFFGWFYLRTGSLPMTMVGHATANGLSILATRLPFDIPGLTQLPGEGVPEFQPLWLDLSGVLILALGVGLFWFATRNMKLEEPAVPPPIAPPEPPAAPPIIW